MNNSHYYSIVTVKDCRKNMRSLPLQLLLLDGEICIPALRWIIDPWSSWLKNQNQNTKKHALSAVGKLYLYYFSLDNQVISRTTDVQKLLRAFNDALLNGTIDRNENQYNDETNLWWFPVRSLTSANKMRIAVEEFVSYCHGNLQYFLFDSNHQKSFIDSILISRRHEHQYNKTSPYNFFRHINENTSNKSNNFIQNEKRDILLDALCFRIRKIKPVKKFQMEHVWNLILYGTIDSRVNTNKQYHEKFDVRDQLMFMFILFGGIRIGALCNLLISDVTPVSDKKNRLRVRLAHPENGKDVILRNGKKEYCSRREFLWEKYSLNPRSLLAGKNFAGNKYLTYDDQNNWDTFLVFAASAQALEHMFNVYLRYVTYIRPKLIKKANYLHPYFFVNDDGSPIKTRNVRDRWQNGCRKIGLSGKQEDGQSPHSGRHFVLNFIKNDLKLNTQEVMEFAKHSDPLSQQVYTVKSADEIQEKISNAITDIHNGNVSAKRISLIETFSKVDPAHLFMNEHDLIK